MFTEGYLYKTEYGYSGKFFDIYNKKEYNVVCKFYDEKKLNVFINSDGKLKRIGTMIEIEPVKIRSDKIYTQVAVIKSGDYDYFVIEDKDKSGKTFYRVI